MLNQRKTSLGSLQHLWSSISDISKICSLFHESLLKHYIVLLKWITSLSGKKFKYLWYFAFGQFLSLFEIEIPTFQIVTFAGFISSFVFRQFWQWSYQNRLSFSGKDSKADFFVFCHFDKNRKMKDEINPAFNPNRYEGWYFYLLVIFSDFVSWFFIKSFQTFWRWKLTSIGLFWNPAQLIESFKSCP